MILAPAEERPSLPLPFSLSPFCLLRSLVLSRFLPFLVFFLPCLSAFFGPLCELPPVIAPVFVPYFLFVLLPVFTFCWQWEPLLDAALG